MREVSRTNRYESRTSHYVIMVRMRGLEPPRCHHHRLLRPARLPVPPHPRGFEYTNPIMQCQERLPLPIATKFERGLDCRDACIDSRSHHKSKGDWPRHTFADSRSTAENIGTSNTGRHSTAEKNRTCSTGFRSTAGDSHTCMTGRFDTAGAGIPRKVWADSCKRQSCYGVV